MNHSTVSAECSHGCCSTCEFEDCACNCHIKCIHDGSDLGCVHLEDDIDAPDETDVCPHGITFDEECEACEDAEEMRKLEAAK